MNKTHFLAATFAAGVLSLSAGTAANAYAPPAFDADGPGVVEPGGRFSVDFSANVNCAWTSTFQGQTGETGTGKDYSPTFTAPTEDGKYTATGSCTWDPATQTPTVLAPISSGNAVTTTSNTLGAASTLLAAPQTDTFTVQVVVGDAAADDDDNSDNGSDGSDSSDSSGSDASDVSDSNGILPNTGGESLSVLVAGGVLIAAGAGAVVATRRRKTA